MSRLARADPDMLPRAPYYVIYKDYYSKILLKIASLIFYLSKEISLKSQKFRALKFI
jgi:hypothetical protein